MKTEPQDEHFSTIRSPEGEFVSKLSPQPQHSFSITKEATRLMQKDHQPTATDDRVKEQVKEQGSHAANSHAAQEWTVVTRWENTPKCKSFVLDGSGKEILAAHRSLCEGVRDAHNAELEAERDRNYHRECEQLGRDRYITKLREALGLKVGEPLTESARNIRQQLLSAQAAIAEHNKEKYPAFRAIDVDLSALDKHVAEKTKRLVDALERIRDSGGQSVTLRAHESNIRIATGALAKFNSDAKTDRASASTLQQP